MSVEDVTRAIELIIAPVVLIAVCSSIQTGLLGRYAALGDRLRCLSRERVELLYTEIEDDTEVLYQEAIQLIDKQLSMLVRRYRLIQNAVLSIYGAILALLFSMFAIALSVVFNSSAIANGVLILFLIGAAILAIAISLSIREIKNSLSAVRDEVAWVRALQRLKAK